MGEGIDESFIFGFLLVGPVFVLCYYHFLPRDATQSAVLLWQVVCPSVCPSVCLSVRNVEVL